MFFLSFISSSEEQVEESLTNTIKMSSINVIILNFILFKAYNKYEVHLKDELGKSIPKRNKTIIHLLQAEKIIIPEHTAKTYVRCNSFSFERI